MGSGSEGTHKDGSQVVLGCRPLPVLFVQQLHGRQFESESSRCKKNNIDRVQTKRRS